MKYYVTIYIDPISDFHGFTHAFLGLTKDKSPDELDEIDKQTRQEKPNKRDWKDFDKRWYESLETSEYNDGFWGFGSSNGDLGIIGEAVGKVFDNNQYIVDANKEKNVYDGERLRSKQTFSSSNRCALEISKEQYEKLLDDIHKDFSLTANVKPQTKQYVDYSLRYDIKDNNCVTWVLNKLDSIGIELIENYRMPGFLTYDFSYLKSYNTTFRKFQVIDSNLESIKGAKAFRDWARSMIGHKYICYVDENALEKEVQRFCKEYDKLEIIRDLYKTRTQLKSVYDRLDALLAHITKKIPEGEDLQGDFELIYFDKQDEEVKILKAQNDYKPETAKFDLKKPAHNYSISKFYNFIFIPKNEKIARVLYHKYDYGKVSQEYQNDRNEFYYNVLAGIQSSKYWSSSYDKLCKMQVG